MIRPLALTLAVAAAATACAQPAFTPAPTFSGPPPAIVRVAAPERDGTSYGSGTLVAVNESSGLVLTNWHVVRDAAGPIVVYFPDGFRSGAYLLRTDRDWDLAALAIRRPNVQPIAIANEAPRPGEQLTIAGYGSGSYRAVTGRLTQYVSPGGDRPFEMIEMSAPARNGDSGGPILNSRGELAGTLFGSAFGRTTGSYCGRLRWFLGSVNGDFQRISTQAMLAQQSRGSAPAATINAGPRESVWQPPGNSPHRMGEGLATNSPLPMGEGLATNSPLPTNLRSVPGEGPGVRAVGVETVAQSPMYPSTSLQTGSPPTQMSPIAAILSSPAGPSPATDQIRSILALIGAMAIVYSALRFLGWAIG